MSPVVARYRPVALLGRARQLCLGISDLDFHDFHRISAYAAW
jgi:hypothetical protein